MACARKPAACELKRQRNAVLQRALLRAAKRPKTQASWAASEGIEGSVSFCVQIPLDLKGSGGHGKRLIVEISPLPTEHHDHDHQCQG
jgi:hypothetical protein